MPGADYGETRQTFLIKGASIGFAGLWGLANFLGFAEAKEKGAAVTATEDLMREHGVLRRLLLIYEEIGRRLKTGGEFPAPLLAKASDLIRHFIQDYHEKNEEDYLFPRFEKAGKMVDLVKVLREQHAAGRRLLGGLRPLATPEAVKEPAARQRLRDYLAAFSRMYRPHAAWEDTVLYPAFRSLASPREFDAVGDKLEERERARFGQGGFEKVVSRVASLEQALGLGDLAQFTPRVP